MTTHTCERCGHNFDLDDGVNPISIETNTHNTNYAALCVRCANEIVKCGMCGDDIFRGNTYVVYNPQRQTIQVCRHCRRTCFICSNCGDIFTPDSPKIDVISRGQHHNVCERCFTHCFMVCSFCGQNKPKITTQVNGRDTTDICFDCLNIHYKRCHHCDNFFTSDNMQTVDGGLYCNDCVSRYADTCSDCGCITFDARTNEHGDDICERCAHSNYEYCDDCDTWCERGHFHARIRNYSYKPQPIFHGKDANGLYVGTEIECEVDSRHSISNIVQHILESFSERETLFYVKQDGSLHNGLEVVSHPHTVTKLIKSTWLPEVLNYLDANGCKSHDTTTCGLHVHLSRSAFVDAMHQTRFAWYIYESGFTVPIARRSFGSYCIKVNKRLTDNRPDNTSSTRYEAVNFENTNTIEVRIFKGTLKIQTIYITLLFLDAVFHWTESVRLPVLASRTRDAQFLKFIQHKPKYTKLYYHLTHLPNQNTGGN